MGIGIKYKGLEDGPILVTPQGRFPSGPPAVAQGPDYNTATGLYLGSGQSAWRLEIRKDEQARVLSQARAKVAELSALLDNLHAPDGDVILNTRTAVSSDPSALTAQADDQASFPAIHSVEVGWPSAGAQVLSSKQNPIAEVDLSDGVHTFTLTIDGVEHQISVNVKNNSSEVDTQEELLFRIGRAIDGVDSRVSAELVTGYEDAYDPAIRSQPMNRTVQLAVKSAESGQGPDFFLSEDDDDILFAYNLDQRAPSRPANIRLNGQLRKQSSDAISLDDGHVTGQALNTTNGKARITVSRGAGVITAELTEVVEKYNALVSYLDSHADLLRPSLKDRIIRPTEERAGELAPLGLWPTASGRLTQAAKLTDQIEYNYPAVRQTLLDADGWTEALKEKLDQILDLDEDAFAASLASETPLQERQRAWALLGYLSQGIIDGYV